MGNFEAYNFIVIFFSIINRQRVQLPVTLSNIQISVDEKH